MLDVKRYSYSNDESTDVISSLAGLTFFGDTGKRNTSKKQVFEIHVTKYLSTGVMSLHAAIHKCVRISGSRETETKMEWKTKTGCPVRTPKVFSQRTERILEEY